LGCGEQKLTAFNAEPDVEITSHDDGDSIKEGVSTTMLAAVDDADDDESELLATWSAGDTVLCDAVPVSESGLSACDVTVAADEGSITVIVQDPGGSTGADSVRLEVEVTSPPQIEIVSPTSDARYYEEVSFDVRAVVSVLADAASPDLTSLSVAWVLEEVSLPDPVDIPVELVSTPDDDGDVEGPLVLAKGAYKITASVTDITGKATSSSKRFDVLGPNQAPTCEWTAPDDGTVLTRGMPVNLEGLVSDPDWEGTPSILSVTWYTDQIDPDGADDGQLDATPSIPESTGKVLLTVDDLILGTHTLTMVVADELGATCTADRSVIVSSEPEVDLIRPRGEVLYYSDHSIQLLGEITDADAPSDALVAKWTSDVEGVLDVSPDLNADGLTEGSVMLSEGPHILTLEGTDLYGLTGSAISSIDVRGPNQAPSCAMVSPESGAGGALGVMTTFTGSVGDPDIGPEPLTVRWSSDRDGELGESTASSDGSVTLSSGALSLGTHTVTLMAMDEVGAVCTDNIVFIVGRPPVVTIGSPADGSVSNVGSVVTFLGSATDADEEESTLTVVWESDRDGVIFTGSPDSTGQTLATSASLTVGDHAITLTATDSLGLTATALSVLRINSMPTTPTIRIVPDPASTTDDLSVAFDVESVDLDLDVVSYRYEWFKGGDLISESGTLSADLTTKHDNWSVRVTPYDPYGDGIATTATRVIQNTPPTVVSVEIGPDEIYTHTEAEAVVMISDADGDTISTTYEWMVNSSPITSDGSSLDGAAWFSKHDVLELTVTPADDDETGASLAASAVVVQNSPPTAATIAILPEDPVGGFDPLFCEIQEAGIDLDGDPVLYTLGWEREGDAYPETDPEDTGVVWSGPLTDEWTGDTVPAADTSPGEEWQCTVTSWDDEEEGGTAMEFVELSEPPPGCGDGLLQIGEEYDPPPGPFLNVSVDPDTCRWDFSDVEQLYCYGFCSWAGPPGCDQQDADVLCRLITDNPESEAITYTITAPLSQPGFPGVYCDFGVLIDTDRGVPDVAWMDESLADHHGGGGEVVAFPDCTDP